MEITLTTILFLATVCTLVVYMDDQFAGNQQKKSRYTRLFVMLLIVLYVIKDKTPNMGGGTGVASVVSSGGMASQNYNVGISPF